MKPIKEAILTLESNKATMADCYFSLAYIGQSIYKIPEDDHMMFRRHAIKIFNERFILYDFDEYLLAYFIHPGYKGMNCLNLFVQSIAKDKYCLCNMKKKSSCEFLCPSRAHF